MVVLPFEEMVTRTRPTTVIEHEEQLLDLKRASEAGDNVGQEAVEHLISQLPVGYALDDENRVVRLDPSLPDHVYIPALIFGVPSDPVRIPVYR